VLQVWPGDAGLASRFRTVSAKTREAAVKVACDPLLPVANGNYPRSHRLLTLIEGVPRCFCRSKPLAVQFALAIRCGITTTPRQGRRPALLSEGPIATGRHFPKNSPEGSLAGVAHGHNR
jgi:hypothetical protein